MCSCDGWKKFFVACRSTLSTLHSPRASCFMLLVVDLPLPLPLPPHRQTLATIRHWLFQRTAHEHEAYRTWADESCVSPNSVDLSDFLHLLAGPPSSCMPRSILDWVTEVFFCQGTSPPRLSLDLSSRSTTTWLQGRELCCRLRRRKTSTMPKDARSILMNVRAYTHPTTSRDSRKEVECWQSPNTPSLDPPAVVRLLLHRSSSPMHFCNRQPCLPHSKKVVEREEWRRTQSQRRIIHPPIHQSINHGSSNKDDGNDAGNGSPSKL
jgi:hypothetical protein